MPSKKSKRHLNRNLDKEAPQRLLKIGKVMKKDWTSEEELRELSPFLQELKRKGDGMKLPDQYFEAMESQVMARLSAEASVPGMRIVKKPALRRLFRQPWLMAVAAGFAGTLLTAWWFVQSGSEAAAPAPSAAFIAQQLSDEDLEAYLLDNIADFDSEQLAVLTPNELPEQSAEKNNETPGRKQAKPSIHDLKEAEMDMLLKDMSDEELEELL